MAAWTLPKRIADWSEFLSEGLDCRSRKYLPTILLGMLLASGRRTVSSWSRSAGVGDNWQDHYYFLQSLGRRAGRVATKLLFVARRWIPVSQVGPYVKLALAAELVEWCVTLFQNWFLKPVLVVVDGAYAKRPFLQRVLATGAIVVSRLRKDAALFDLPPVKRGGRGRPRKYGTRKLSLAGRGRHRQGWTQTRMVLYGVEQLVTFKTFLATYRPVGGPIRVVIVKRSPQLFADSPTEWVAFFCTDTGVSAETILESVADRSSIEQNFHDVKEVHGAGQQQVRNVWCNVACWNLCLWLHTLVEVWSWRHSGTTLKQRSDRPWDDPSRRPSHADRLKTLRKQVLDASFSALPRPQRMKQKIRRLFQTLSKLVL